MKFSQPDMFYLIWVVILLAGVTLYGIRKRTRILSQFISLSLVSDMAPGALSRRRWIKGGLLLGAFLLATLALTGPQMGFHWEKVEQKGVDIMIALDCSRSMLATDIKPTRLERSKREIIDLLKMMKSDRAGLVAFSGTAFVQCPLTLDHSAFGIFLKALNPDYLPRGGTDLGGAIATALKGFEWKVASEKAIIIITDGENTSGEDPLTVAEAAAKKGVRIFCIGVGQKQGAPIPDAAGGFKKDASGNIVMSRVDDEALEKIAALARGIYVKSVAGDMDLDLIYKGQILKNMKRTTIESGRKKVWEDRFQWVLLPSVLLLILELIISEKKKNSFEKKKDDSRHAVFSLILCCVSSLIGMALLPVSPAHAGASKSVAQGIQAYQHGKWEKAEKSFIDAQLDRPDMPEIYYNIGSAAYKKGDYESAMGNFKKAMDTDNNTLKQKAAFNLGNTQYRRGNLEAALKAYEKIPKASPLFSKAAENIKFVKQKIKEKKKSHPNQKSSKDGEKKDSKKQDKKNSDNKRGASGEKQKKQQNNHQDKKKGPDGQPKKKNDSHSDSRKSNASDHHTPSRNHSKPGEKNKNQDNGAGKTGQKKSGKQQQTHAGKQDKHKKDQGKQTSPGNQDNSLDMGALKPQQQQMLDRLEDHPGRAMMPAYPGGRVEKDW